MFLPFKPLATRIKNKFGLKKKVFYSIPTLFPFLYFAIKTYSPLINMRGLSFLLEILRCLSCYALWRLRIFLCIFELVQLLSTHQSCAILSAVLLLFGACKSPILIIQKFLTYNLPSKLIHLQRWSLYRNVEAFFYL